MPAKGADAFPPLTGAAAAFSDATLQRCRVRMYPIRQKPLEITGPVRAPCVETPLADLSKLFTGTLPSTARGGETYTHTPHRLRPTHPLKYGYLPERQLRAIPDWVGTGRSSCLKSGSLTFPQKLYHRQ